MATKAADLLIEILQCWGVEVIFGRPGAGVSGILDSLARSEGLVRFIQAWHDEAAALMASGYARFTGKLGVCLAPTGPGGVRLLNGLFDARLDGLPVLAITGSLNYQFPDVYGQYGVSLERLMVDAAIFNTRITSPGQVEAAVNLACRAAISRGGVAHIHFPEHLQSENIHREEIRGGQAPLYEGVYSQRAYLPHRANLRGAAEVLNAGEKVVILAGQGAGGASSELELAAEILGAPLVKTLMGKAVVSDDSPYTTGVLGPFGTQPSFNAVQACDTLLLVGTSFAHSSYLPDPRRARVVQIDIDAVRIGLRCPVEVGLVGDSQRTLKDLLPLLLPKQSRQFLERAQNEMAAWWKDVEEQALQPAKGLKPQLLAWQTGELLPDNALVASDTGQVAGWWSRWLRTKPDQKHTISGNLAAPGASLPYAIAAQAAYPDRLCVALAEEGSFAMSLAGFATCVQYQLPVKVIVFKDESCSSSKAQLEPLLHSQPGDIVSSLDLRFPDIDLEAFARACGGTGFTIDDPMGCVSTLTQAFQTPGPVIVQAYVDPSETLRQLETSQAAALPVIPRTGLGEDGKPLDLSLIAEKLREILQNMTGR